MPAPGGRDSKSWLASKSTSHWAIEEDTWLQSLASTHSHMVARTQTQQTQRTGKDDILILEWVLKFLGIAVSTDLIWSLHVNLSEFKTTKTWKWKDVCGKSSGTHRTNRRQPEETLGILREARRMGNASYNPGFWEIYLIKQLSGGRFVLANGMKV